MHCAVPRGSRPADRVQAEAYGVLELDANARASAEKGLALVPDGRDPVHLELLMAYTAAVYDSAGIASGHSDHRGRSRLIAVRIA